MNDEARPAAGDDPHTFERSLKALEAIVVRLEQGEVGLEEAVSLFEQGREHLEHCRERLALAQARIEELTGAPDSPPPDPLEGGGAGSRGPLDQEGSGPR